MDRPEVWMSEALTPVRLSADVTARTAEFAWRRAAATEPALVCTPIDRASWFGTPDTFPVPVTVIRAPPEAGAVAAVSAAPAVASPEVAGAALPWPAPRVNAPMSRPAAATPAATARWAEENWTAMVPLRRYGRMGHRLDAGAVRLVPGSARSAGRRLRSHLGHDLPDVRHHLRLPAWHVIAGEVVQDGQHAVLAVQDGQLLPGHLVQGDERLVVGDRALVAGGLGPVRAHLQRDHDGQLRQVEDRQQQRPGRLVEPDDVAGEQPEHDAERDGIVSWLFAGNVDGFDKTPWPLLLTILNLPQRPGRLVEPDDVAGEQPE